MKILLGAIVTQMAGSVGGQTVRRSQHGQILYNKSQKRNTASISKNTQVRLMQKLMTNWNNLPQEYRTAVELDCKVNVFTNKFGQPVYLSPYNYFLSAMTKLNLVNNPNPVNLLESSILPSTDFNLSAVIRSDQLVVLENESNPSNTYFILSVYVTPKNTITPTAKMAKIIHAGTYFQYNANTAYEKLKSFYPEANIGWFCTFFIQAVAYNGYSGGFTYFNKKEITTL